MKAASFVLLLLLLIGFGHGTALLPAQAASVSDNRGVAQAATRLPLGDTTIQRIRQRGNRLVAGVLFDHPPLGYLNEQGEVAGFEVDLVRALAHEWGVTVQFIPVTPATRLQSLLAGQVDLVAAALPHTYAAEALIDFSTDYFIDNPALLAHSDTPLTVFAQLAGKTVAAIQGDSALPALQTALAATTVDTTLIPFHEYAPALLALKSGQADTLLAHRAYLTAIGKAAPELGVLFALPESQPFALGVAQGDAYFRNLVDATLRQLQKNGELAALYRDWFPDRPLPTFPPIPGVWPYTFATLPSNGPTTATRLAQIHARRKLLVGVAYDFPPFGFVGADGQIQGFDIDLCRELARRWLGDGDALELVRVTPETAIPLLRAGQVDLIVAALPLNWHNRALIDFSQSYFADGQSLLTRADSPVLHLADLDQKVVAVSGGLESVNEVTSLIMGSAAGVSVAPTVLPFQEVRSAQQALLLGQVDAVIGSSVVLAQSLQATPGLKVALANFAHQPYAIGIPQFDAQLRDQVNVTLQAMQGDGTYATLYQRWFAATPEPLALWFADSLTTDPLAQVPLARQPALFPTLETTLAPGSAILRPTATPPLPTVPPVALAAVAQQPLILQPTATPVQPVTTVTTATMTLTPTVATPSPVLIATRTAPLMMTATTASPATVTIRSGLNANARQAPTTTASILAVLAGGTQWPVRTVAADGQWVEVQLPAGVRAWVAIQLTVAEERPLSARQPTATLAAPVTPPPAATATPRLLFTNAVTHRIQATDTLATIAEAYYGAQRHWRLIYEANRTLIGDDPNAIPVGAELMIPPLAE